MPLTDGATEWLGSEPLGPSDLQGHVVLVDFWTFTCINWLRTAPYIRAWANEYRDDGLVVIGVHTPEFSFEHDIHRVRTRHPAFCSASHATRWRCPGG
jgi:thiol-disulfide isomerase/thioredoxin